MSRSSHSYSQPSAVRGPATPGTPPARPSAAWDDGLPPPPQSALSLYQLGFGTVAGFCAGVFTKKGVKAAAWLLGGIFVLLQVCRKAD